MYGHKVIKTEFATYYEPLEGYDICDHCEQFEEVMDIMDEELNMVSVCQECANATMRAGG